MKKMTKLMALLCMALAFSQGAYAADDVPETLLVINNQPYVFQDNQPQLEVINERTYVPLRVISEALGHQVTWIAEENQIAIQRKNTPAGDTLSKNSSDALEILIDGKVLTIPSELGAPYVKDGGYTMLPLRAVSDALDCTVIWEPGLVVVEEIPKVVPPPVVVAPPTVVTNPGISTIPGQEFITNPMHTLTIMGPSLRSQAQIENFLEAKTPDIKLMLAKNYPGRAFIPFPDNIVGLYLDLGKKYNIRGDLAFAQALKETGYFQFYGSVQSFQNNYCGLGATGLELTGDEPLNGVDPLRAFYIPSFHGLSFATPADGVEAHLQHLYAYACNDPLPVGLELVDPRFQYLKRGVAPRWIDLNGRWAIPGDGYGQSVIDDYWSLISAY